MKKSRAKKPAELAPKKKSEPITFELFFAKCVREDKLKFWQREEIAWFFRDMRLRDKEDLEVYEEALKGY
jgi:hypothetical protein